MRRTYVQLQKDFDRILKRVQKYKYRNINGKLNRGEVQALLEYRYKLRKMFKCAVISSNKANKRTYSRNGVFSGVGGRVDRSNVKWEIKNYEMG